MASSIPSGPGLVGHLRDAIRLNRSRRAGYVRRGGRRAAVLSRLLVGMERALLPAAWILDRQAAPFNRAGVPILWGDLVDLAHAPDPERPLSMSDGLEQTGRLPLMTSLLSNWRSVWSGDLVACAHALGDALAEIREAERDTGDHYALAAHVVESAGLAALRGADYAEATSGETLPLTRRIVLGHLALVPMALAMDRAARPLNASGVGLFVNDLPPVPFEAELYSHA